MRITWLAIFAMGITMAAPALQAQPNADLSTEALRAPNALAEGFTCPPRSAAPYTWWHWIDDNITTIGITRDLEAMHAVGLAGAQIFNVGMNLPSGPATFMSPQWREAMAHAFKEADRLGLDLGVHNCGGWSSSGGPWIDPPHSMQQLTFSEVTLEGPQAYQAALPMPEHKLDYYRDIALLAVPLPANPARLADWRIKACYDPVGIVHMPAPAQPVQSTTITLAPDAIDPARIVRLDAQLTSGGQLTWQVPAGRWLLLRLGHSTTGKTNHPATLSSIGLECDKLSTAALQLHWSGMMQAALDAAGPLAGRAFGNVIIDSYEVFAQNWTPGLEEEFAARRGYALQPWMPVLAGYVVASAEQSERFLYDFRRTLAELFTQNYYGEFGRLAREHGLRYYIEPYGNGNFDVYEAGAEADVPMGEFWTTGAAAETVKLAASIAHVQGKPVVAAESFTANPEPGRWLNSPASLKVLGDRMFCLGLTQMVFHRYTHQPWENPPQPGMTMGPFGLHFERTNTWWEMAPAWIEYLSRCQWMLRQGQPVADIAMLSPTLAQPDSALATRPQSIPAGYDYDVLGAGSLKHMQSSWRRGMELPHGTRYRLLLLPDSPWMDVETAEQLLRIVNDGGWIAGRRPTHNPSLSHDAEATRRLQKLTLALWGDPDDAPLPPGAWREVGAGRVFSAWPTGEQLQAAGLPPDCLLTPAGGGAVLPHREPTFIHRRGESGELFFIANPGLRPLELNATFRFGGVEPELWDPLNGTRKPVVNYACSFRGTTVTLRLEAGGSVFLTFRGQRYSAEPVDSYCRTEFRGASRNAAQPAVQSTPLRIVHASYGAGAEHRVDVTARVQEHVQQGFLVGGVSNDWLGGDPLPGTVKTLHLEYEQAGERRAIDVAEGEWLELPTTDPAPAPAPYEMMGTERVRLWQSGEVVQARSLSPERSSRRWDVPEPLELRGPWTVRFDAGGGAPAQTTFTQLIDWARHPDPAVRYFSGGAVYETHFNFTPQPMRGSAQMRQAIDLGAVMVIAAAEVNGMPLGTSWAPPHRLTIPDGVLRPGDNVLRVRVKNLWVNRLIGDEQLPVDVEYKDDGPLAAWPAWLTNGLPRTSGRHAFSTWHHWGKDDPLQPSGLIGPVLLRHAVDVELQQQEQR